MKYCYYVILFLVLWIIPEVFIIKRLSAYGKLDDLLVVLLIVYMVIKLIFNLQFKISSFNMLFSLYLVSIVGSILLSDSIGIHSLTATLLFIKPWVIILFLNQYKYGDLINSIKNAINIMLGVGLINLIVVLSLRIIIGSSYDQDNAKGIMGNAHYAGEYIYMLLLFSYYQIIEKNRYLYMIIVILGFFGLLITETTQLIIFAFLSTLIFVFIKMKLNLIKVVQGTIISTVFVLILFLSLRSNSILITQFYRVQEVALDIENLTDFMALEMLFNDNAEFRNNYFIFGAGPGNFGSRVGAGRNTPLYNKYMEPLNWINQDSGTINDPNNQIQTIMSELGLFGLTGFMLLIIFMLFHIIKFNKIKKGYELLYYLFIGEFFQICSRFLVEDVFFMNNSLLIILFIFPLIYKMNNEFNFQNKKIRESLG